MSRRPYAVPLVYWTAAIVGLVMALLGDGWVDLLGLTLLSAPLLALVHASVVTRR